MSRRLSSLAALASAILIALSASPVWAVQSNVSFAGSYAGELDSYGGGSVTYKAGSGVTNYLRATAAGDASGLGYNTVSIRQGRITSSPAIHFSGPTNGHITVKINGTFTRDLSGGISIANGAGYRHQIALVLRDQSAGTDVRTWTLVDEEILCGGLVYPVGLGGCNGATSDTYPSAFTRTASGTGIVSGHNYVVRVLVASIINAAGLAGGLQGRTTARDLSGTLSW